MAELEKKNRELERQLKEATSEKGPPDQKAEQMGKGECTSEADALAMEINRLQRIVESLETNGAEEEAKPKRAQLEEAKAKRAAAKPIAHQLRDAQRKATAAKRAAENIDKTLAKLVEESQALEAKVKETQSKAKLFAHEAAQRQTEYQNVLQMQR